MSMRNLTLALGVAACIFAASCDRRATDEHAKRVLAGKTPGQPLRHEVPNAEEGSLKNRAHDLTPEEVKNLTKDWDEIGSYTLKENDVPFKVKLYFYDSDSEAKTKGVRIYPNGFSMHAIYQQVEGPQRHVKLYSRSRVGYRRIADIKPESVAIQLGSKLMLRLDENGKLPFDEERIAELNKPIDLIVSVEHGIPVMKDVPPGLEVSP